MISFHANSLTITTPAQYEQLKLGEFTDSYDTIFIRPNAHPNILLEPKRFWNTRYFSMNFHDGQGNQIAIYPIWQSVVATFHAGANLTLGIPSNYQTYHLLFDGESSFTTTDLDYILEWKETRSISINSEDDIAVKLLQRIDELKQLEHLERFFVYIERHSFRNVKVVQFLDQLKSLQLAQFSCYSLSKEEIEEFVKSQQTPNEWVVSINDKLVQFQKKKFRRAYA